MHNSSHGVRKKMPHKTSEPAKLSDSTPRADLPVTRRSFLGKATAATVLAGLSNGVVAGTETKAPSRAVERQDTFLDLLRVPDAVTAYSRLEEPLQLQRSGSEWHGHGVSVESKAGREELAIAVAAP